MAACRFPTIRCAAVLAASLSWQAAAAAPAPAELGQRLAGCAAPLLQAADIEVDSGSGGFAIEALRERHWLELAGRASLTLRQADGREVARVRIHVPVAGHYAQQQRWREHALLDAAARGGGRVRQLDLADDARLVTLNKPAMEGRYAGVSLLSDPGRGVFVQWHWTRLEEYADGGALAAAQQSVLQPLLACLLAREAG
jgi:hypothetical protein